jgi:hypothetical protein
MKKLFAYSLALLAGLFLTTARVWAQDTPKQDAESLDQPAAVSVSDLEVINNRLKALETNQGSAIKVGALVQFWYTHDSWGTTLPGGTLNGSANDYTSSKNQWDAFSFKRGEISLGSTFGNDPNVSWLLKIDPTQTSFTGLGIAAGAPLTYTGSTQGASSQGNINPFSIVKDLYVKIAYSPYATLILGQNKFAQDLEGRWASGDLDFNNLSNVAAAFGNKRDIGVQLAGTGIPVADLPLQCEYVLSVIQGSGQSTADNNVDKDLAARAGFTYDKNLFLGVSGYDGWEVSGPRWDFGLEGRWVYQGFKVQAEFIQGSVNAYDSNSANNSVWTPYTSTSFPAGLENNLKFTIPSGQLYPTGYYLSTNYRYQDWRLGVRWDGYNFNQWAGSLYNQEFDTVTVGLDWYQDKDALKLSLNFEDHLLDGVEAYQVTTIQSQISL